jgi:gliding motility-associated-like protein
MHVKHLYTLLFLLTSLIGWSQCDVYITPGSVQVIDHNPGISFAFEIQNDDIIPYSGGPLYMDWALSGFISGPIWDFNLNPIPIFPGGSRFVSTPVFDIPLPGNVPGNWTPYAGWTGSEYTSFKLALEPILTPGCYEWITNEDGTLWTDLLSDGCDNPDGDNFCNDACHVELVDYNLETEELTIIPYSTYCPNIINSAWFNQYPYDNPYIFGFTLTFTTSAGSINVNLGGQQIYESDTPIIIDLSNGILSIILEPILESINNGDYCELTLVLYNLNNTGQNINDVLPHQVIELINLCPDIYGCTDIEANNYDSTATIDDESCLYDVLGCTDSSAINYNSLANIDDGSCEYDVFGCTDTFATNYNPLATVDDGGCEYIIYIEGCTDLLAINYNEAAAIDNGSCVYNLCDAIWIPNAFSPNNDGMNDGWTVEADPECWLEWDIRIYNRWGQLVWESNIVGEVWYGSNRNGSHYVADGVYIYTVKGIGHLPSNTFQTRGYIMVFR